MHVVFDAFAVRAGSAAITLTNLLNGWVEHAPGDRITVLASGTPEFSVPAGVRVEVVGAPVSGPLGSLWLRSVGVRRGARRLAADALVSGVTASGFVGAPCPRGVIVYDLRHELRPHQFSRSRRVVRRLSYALSFRGADGLYCISERTRDDLVRNRPRLRAKAVVARYGADHADTWPVPKQAARPYALAFGQFANKNVDRVLDAWAAFCRDDAEMDLRLVGMGRADRAAATERVARLGIADRVDLMPWLDDDAFLECFTGASLIVFPSDFEGFGLPAVEALRLRLPLVVSGDVALAEVTGGHAAVATDLAPEPLAAAMRRALASTEAEREAGRAYTERFAWRFMAAAIRGHLVALRAARPS